jgi:AcrR family transcriptional regulator
MGAVTAVDRGDRVDRAPKQDRSRATRQRLLEAAVACLAEHGWAGSTVSVVAERAGVSRGAAQHHFPTREDLFTAAVEYVAEERSTALRALFPDGAAGDRRTVVTALVDLYTGRGAVGGAAGRGAGMNTRRRAERHHAELLGPA